MRAKTSQLQLQCQRLGASGLVVSCGCGGGRRSCAQKSALTPPKADWIAPTPASADLTGAIAVCISRVNRLHFVSLCMPCMRVSRVLAAKTSCGSLPERQG
jgi:hypothetical protein